LFRERIRDARLECSTVGWMNNSDGAGNAHRLEISAHTTRQQARFSLCSALPWPSGITPIPSVFRGGGHGRWPCNSLASAKFRSIVSLCRTYSCIPYALSRCALIRFLVLHVHVAPPPWLRLHSGSSVEGATCNIQVVFHQAFTHIRRVIACTQAKGVESSTSVAQPPHGIEPPGADQHVR
jgi:hypothetical protein